MKKKILSIAVVTAVAVAAAWGFNKSNNEVALADVALSNVEALADGESSSNTCYNTITSKDGSQVLYCQTCSWISGTYSWFSGKGSC